MNICKIIECGRNAVSKGFCHKHWRRFKKYGDPLFRKKRGNGEGGTSRGYWFIYVNGIKYPIHRYLMEQKLGRKLLPFPFEIVHHINGNKLDNRIENLELMKSGDHTIFHHRKSIIVGNRKLCTQCHMLLPLKRFSKAKDCKQGFRPNCKSCENIYNKNRLERIKSLESP